MIADQDYEQTPQMDRELLMVHCFYYPNGLDGEIGDLMVLPKSHRSVMSRGAFSSIFRQEKLPGSIWFGSEVALPRGSVVIAHSALMHGRKQQPGGEPSKPRYFTDVSYRLQAICYCHRILYHIDSPLSTSTVYT